jgi:hypothetical protein
LGIDARLTTLLYKKNTAAKSKEVRTGWSNSRQIWHSSKEGYGSKRAVLPMMMNSKREKTCKEAVVT